MTYKELLCSVTFEEVEPHIVSMYPKFQNSIGWFKLHFDMLRLIEPKHHDNSVCGDVCHIKMNDCKDGTEPHLYAFPIMGEFFEHALTMEIVLEANVHATNAEIAACCLWHTSYYRYFGEQATVWPDVTRKTQAKELKKTIIRHGGYVPSKRELLPSKRQELIEKAKKDVWYRQRRGYRTHCKSLFRFVFMEEYYERMGDIGSFIAKVLPALSLNADYLTISQLCKLYYSNTFVSVTLHSYADEKTDAVSYLADLISKYDMLPQAGPQADNIIIYFATGYPWSNPPVVNTNEDNLLTLLRDKVITTEEIEGSVDIIFDYNPAADKQIEVTVVVTDISIWE